MTGSDWSQFGGRLKRTRADAGMSQTELADRAGLTPSAVSQLESGERLPAFKTLSQLAAALNSSVGYLVGEEPGELPPALSAMFRDLDALSSEDQRKVKDYAAFLKSEAARQSKK